MLALAALLTVLFRGAETGPEDEPRSREDLIAFLSMPAEEQFRPVVPGYVIAFPRDHGPHPDFRQEWWYFTGRLESPAGRVFGYQLTFFRFRTGGAGIRPDSAWSSDQSWMAHLALTDVDGERFTAREDFARGALGLAGAEAAPLAIWVNGWSVRATGRNEACDGCFTARLIICLDHLLLVKCLLQNAKVFLNVIITTIAFHILRKVMLLLHLTDIIDTLKLRQNILLQL